MQELEPNARPEEQVPEGLNSQPAAEEAEEDIGTEEAYLKKLRKGLFRELKRKEKTENAANWNPRRAAVFALVGLVVAVLLLTIGLGRTLFLTVFVLLGVFLGGVPRKGEFFKDLINRLFPPRN